MFCEYERSMESDLSKEHVPTQDFPSDDKAFSSPSQAQKKLPSVFSHTSVHPPLSTAHSLISKNREFHEIFIRHKSLIKVLKIIYIISYINDPKRCIVFIKRIFIIIIFRILKLIIPLILQSIIFCAIIKKI